MPRGPAPEEQGTGDAASWSLVSCLALSGLALFVWGLGTPHPAWLLFFFLLSAPWVGFALTLRAAIAPWRLRVIGTALLLYPVSLALFTRGISDYPPLRWVSLLALAAFAGLVFADRAVAWLMPSSLPKLRGFATVALTPAFFLYCLGVILVLNGNFDGAQPERIRTAVLDQYSARAGTKTSYHLRLGAWGDRPSRDYAVTHLVYDTVRPGDDLCVLRHQGALAIPWFVVASCQR